MAHDHDNHDETVSRRHALQSITLGSTGVLWTVLGGAPKSLRPVGRAEAATATAQTKPTIPIIVKDTTSPYWQMALAGARKAGEDLGVSVIELDALSESDIDGQISILRSESAGSLHPGTLRQ
jgi:ABC-type sugar transport system substrate-binding protein